MQSREQGTSWRLDFRVPSDFHSTIQLPHLQSLQLTLVSSKSFHLQKSLSVSLKSTVFWQAINAMFLPTISQNVRLLAPTNWVSCHPFLLPWKGTNIPKCIAESKERKWRSLFASLGLPIPHLQLPHLSHRFRSPFNNFNSLSCPPNLPTTKSDCG